LYLRKENEGICPLCKKETRFLGLEGGYNFFCKTCCRGYTKEKWILRYGEEEGNKRWEHYCNLQGETNTFEYKNKKYEMTREEFDAYNKTRTQTLELMIKRHGEEEGKKRWKSYCDKQAYVGCKKEYFIEKYGEIEGLKKFEEIGKQKSHSLDSFIKKFGEIEGSKKFEECWNKKTQKYSKISQIIFWKIFENIKNEFNNEKIYFAEYSKEFNRYDKITKKRYYLDFCISDKKKIIEFNGICFHANPKLTEEEKKKWINPYSKDNYYVTLQKDKEKEEYFVKNGWDYLIIWEDDYYENPEKNINSCIEFLRKENNGISING
jgi:very-short-patch-repair endonuclease